MTGTAVAVLCALAAAALIAVGSVAQQTSAAAVPDTDSFVGSLLRSPRWWAGILGDGGSYVLQVIALVFGSVLLVQPLLVASLLFALPLAAATTGRRVTRTTWLLAGALCAALAIFLLVGNPSEGTGDAAAARWALPLGTVLAVTAAAVVVALLSPRRRALSFGIAAGVLYGVTSAFTKHVTDLAEHGIPQLLGSWQTRTLVAAGATAIYLQQRAFQAGSLTASLPALTVGEPIAAIVLGMTVLGEHLRTDGPGRILVSAAVVVMLVTTVALSRAQAADTPADAAATPAPAPPPETPRHR
ncbi:MULTISPECIES: DMT family transporter [Rhodococcus]|uniref:DMT family transporter n=1 Tax=Rhodococcus TaxID=1827 RepID=UPI001E3A2CB8|nr:DMT family transporter [Rhodococcus pyridinivorans]MCD2118669.1 DMT family transporter [Rhodococcus pyridinivorans]MCZ4627540.1 DMT family transporter [Rhodococcus pyridinivorans]MCZ4648694.1 DMT family transporter [Rhodococcus pyridinivorans]MDJ0481245.1 DMT family transporter [Rhodococcus pyridinivorans]MDV7254884.1 DMT family transporter [Rhodococcus pyridinivorans]